MIKTRAERRPHFLQLLALATVAIWGLVQAQAVLIPLCLSALIAFTLLPGVEFLRRRGIPEWLALLLVAFSFIIPLAAVIYGLAVQGEALVREFPDITAFLTKQIAILSASPLGQRFNLAEVLDLSSLPERLSREAGVGLGALLDAFKSFLSAGGELLLILLFAFLMIGARETLKRSSEEILAHHWSGTHRISPRQLLHSIIRLIERFLLVRLAIMIFVAGVDWAILAAFDVPFSLFGAGLLGAATIIPAVGFIISAGPVLVIAAVGGFSLARLAGLLAGLLVVSAIESYVLSPKLLGRHLNINLLFTFLGLFVGAQLWGGWGMLLSVPILGIARIILNQMEYGVLWSQLMAEKDDRLLRVDSRKSA